MAQELGLYRCKALQTSYLLSIHSRHVSRFEKPSAARTAVWSCGEGLFVPRGPCASTGRCSAVSGEFRVFGEILCRREASDLRIAEGVSHGSETSTQLRYSDLFAPLIVTEPVKGGEKNNVLPHEPGETLDTVDNQSRHYSRLKYLAWR